MMYLEFRLKEEFRDYAPNNLSAEPRLSTLAKLFNDYGAKSRSNELPQLRGFNADMITRLKEFSRGRIVVELNEKAPVGLVQSFVESLKSAALEDVIESQSVVLHYSDPVQLRSVVKPPFKAKLS